MQKSRDFVALLQRTEKWQGLANKPHNGERLSAQTVANHVRVMKAFASWLWEEGYTTENALTRLGLPKVPRKVIEVLSHEEMGQLLSSIDLSFSADARDLAIITLLLDTGLRLSELISLKVDDVHFEDQ